MAMVRSGDNELRKRKSGHLIATEGHCLYALSQPSLLPEEGGATPSVIAAKCSSVYSFFS